MGEARLPGDELVASGLEALAAGELTEEALAVLATAPRLRRAGVEVPQRADEAEASRELYRRLSSRLGTGPHSRHHAMLRRVASYASARARAGAG